MLVIIAEGNKRTRKEFLMGVLYKCLYKAQQLKIVALTPAIINEVKKEYKFESFCPRKRNYYSYLYLYEKK